MTELNTAAELARSLGMLNTADVEVYISEVLGLDLHYDAVPPEIAADVRTALDPHGERTAPARLYWPDHVENPKPSSPTAGEGFYDEDDQ